MPHDPTHTVPRGGGTGPPLPPAPPGTFDGGAPDHVGRFRLLGELGRGGMGVVYRARDNLEREVALKVLLPELATDPRAKARFLRESRAQARVAHEHVVPIYEAGEADAFAYLVMPLLQGQTLKDALRGARAPVPELVRIGRETAEGLAAAHAVGLIHRDVKPGNIWLEGDKRRVKVLDFGLARAAADAPDGASTARARPVSAELSAAGALTGTPAYMSPEQARGGAVDLRSDVFALGVVLYELATGRKPFRGTSVFEILAAITSDEPPPAAQLAPDLPPALADLIARMLAKDPAARPQSCTEVSAALSALAVPRVVVLPLEGSAAPSVWEDLTAADGNLEPQPERTEADAPPVPRAARPKWLWPAVAGAVALLAVCAALALRGKPAEQAKNEPDPPKPAPKDENKGKTKTKPNDPPKPPAGDEVVLFDGTDLSQWRSVKSNGPAQWPVSEGSFEVVPGFGNIYSAEKFRDHTIHLEYWLPPGDKSGNSGVYVHGCYEVTIFDDAGKLVTNTTTGGIYGRHAPLKNASKPAGEWQTFDITFTAARGAQLPRITVVHNGEKVLDGAEMTANTALSLPQLVTDSAGPVMLQDHGSRVRFRNVRVRRFAAARAADERAAAARALALGGEVTVRQSGSDKPVKKGEALPSSAFELVHVNLSRLDVTDADLAAFADCTNLLQFHIGHNPRFTGDGLVHLKACKKLQSFVAGSTPLSDAGFAHLRGLPALEHCALSNCPNLTNKIVETCRELPALTSIDLRDMGINEAGARAISDACRRCRVDWGTGGPGKNVIGPKEK